MIIFSHKVTPRLQYVADFLSDYFQHAFHVTAEAGTYSHTTDYKINYSPHRLHAQEFHINPQSLLYDSDIKELAIQCFEHKQYVAFFKTEGDLSFDLFASLFFLLSRYEEYLPHQKNKYGLYDHTNSLAFKEGFLQLPLINLWLEDFRQVLEEKFGGNILQNKAFEFIPTYDIDIAWRYKEKSFLVHYGSLLRSVLKGQFREIKERISAVHGSGTDPYDAYDWMSSLHERFQLSPLYFFLVASKQGIHDKNPRLQSQLFRRLIKNISDKYKTGLHPSWYSGDHEESLAAEKAWLQSITGKPIHSSRQHFLRFYVPVTFQRLLGAGIMHDYSMGYNAVNGFRASIASSFYWYDLEREQSTALKIHPFCFMDATSFYYQHSSPQQALEELIHYYTTIQSVRGTMITLWHNNFLGTDPEFSGWRETYERFITHVHGQSNNLID